MENVIDLDGTFFENWDKMERELLKDDPEAIKILDEEKKQREEQIKKELEEEESKESDSDSEE